MKYVRRSITVNGRQVGGYIAWPEKYIRIEVYLTPRRTWRALGRLISRPNVDEQEITLRDVVHSIIDGEHYSSRQGAAEDALMRIKASAHYHNFLEALASL